MVVVKEAGRAAILLSVLSHALVHRAGGKGGCSETEGAPTQKKGDTTPREPGENEKRKTPFVLLLPPYADGANLAALAHALLTPGLDRCDAVVVCLFSLAGFCVEKRA